jgi:hypothetical protein
MSLVGGAKQSLAKLKNEKGWRKVEPRMTDLKISGQLIELILQCFQEKEYWNLVDLNRILDQPVVSTAAVFFLLSESLEAGVNVCLRFQQIRTAQTNLPIEA